MSLPTAIIALLTYFEPCFSQPTWRKATLLLVGTILARGRRTVTAALRITAHQHDKHFSSFHHVLNRARFSPLLLSRRLLSLLVHSFVPADAAITIVIDEHLERRWGAKISRRGHYRDSTRSSKGTPVSSSGLRWICVALLVAVPWSRRPWALPFLVILTTPPAVDQAAGWRHKTVADWAMQVARLLRRWLPGRELVMLGDGAYACLDLAVVCEREQVVLAAPFHLDAGLYEPAPPRALQQSRKPRVKGAALPKLELVALDARTHWCRGTVDWYAQGQREKEWCSGTAIWYRGGKSPLAIRWLLVRTPGEPASVRSYFCTAPDWTAEQLMSRYMGRWNLEVTFAECREHLGVETQRQWTDQAIGRSTPLLLGLYSLLVLCAQSLHPDGRVPVAQAAWYAKEQATFSDVLATVRRHIWTAESNLHCADMGECIMLPRRELDRLLHALAA